MGSEEEGLEEVMEGYTYSLDQFNNQLKDGDTVGFAPGKDEEHLEVYINKVYVGTVKREKINEA